MHVEQSTFDLRPGSTLQFEEKELHIGTQSTCEIKNAIVDHNLNYHGDCLVNLKLLNNCKWIGQRAYCEFQGGEVRLQLRVSKVDNQLLLALDDKHMDVQRFRLEQCKFRFGKNHRSSSLSEK